MRSSSLGSPFLYQNSIEQDTAQKEEKFKSNCELTGQSRQHFNLIGIAQRILKNNDLHDEFNKNI